MNGFSKAVKECREKESPRVLENASIEHAKELFVNLIEEGQSKKEDIAIVSGNLNREFYSQLVPVAKEALKTGINISLLIADPSVDTEGHPFVNVLLDGGGSVYKARTSLIDTSHFIVVGEKRFRLETDHAQTKALACFNNAEVGKVLNKAFVTLIKSDNVTRIENASA